MANTQTARRSAPIAADTDATRKALENKDDTKRYSDDVARVNEEATKQPVNTMSTAERRLVGVVEDLREYVKREGIDERHHNVAAAVYGFLQERQAASNHGVTMTLKDIRNHIWQLIGYKQSKNKFERAKQESLAFEMIVGRGIREGLLAFTGHKGAQLIRLDETSNKYTFVMPSNQLTPKIDMLDPDTGKSVGQQDNPKTELVPVPISKLSSLFNEAFPGSVTQRSANHTGDGEKSSKEQGLGKVATAELITAMTLRIGMFEQKLQDEGKKPDAETLELFNTMYEALDHFLGLVDTADKPKARTATR